ncbi:hypothetical protein P8452_42187 [Trifolium repens]|nr:hypothetical protein P8452_42187 [Trifolium repens]
MVILPWIENLYMDAIERNAFGGLSLDAFLSKWALMTHLNPTIVVYNLICIGYPGDPSSAIRAGKSALLNSLIGRPYFEAYNPTNEDRYAVNVVDISRENKKYLFLFMIGWPEYETRGSHANQFEVRGLRQYISPNSNCC